MIRDKDRSGFIGASDTERVMGRWNTKTFERWWMEKLGYYHNDFTNEAMMTGSALEHRILEALSIPGLRFDEQKISGRLRVNLDGFDGNTIYEVKTHRYKPGEAWKPPKKYIEQVRVQMMAFGVSGALIVSYGLLPREYRNWYLPIDLSRIDLFPVFQDDWFRIEWGARMSFLSYHLENGLFPDEKQFNAGFKFERK